MNKSLSTLIFALVFMSSFTFAQTQVVPGSGTLTAAIQAAQPGDVLELTSGGEYTEADSINFGILAKALTIQVAPDATEKAVVKYAETSVADDYYFIVQNGGSLTLKGIEFSGMVGGVAAAKSLLFWDGGDAPADARAGTIRIEDCVIHDFKDNTFHGFKKAHKGMVQDSLIIDNTIIYNSGKAFIRMKYISLNYLSLTNSTFYAAASYGIFMGTEDDRGTTISPTAIIDHCTFNDMAPFVEVPEMSSPWTITNSIFSNISDPAKVGLDWSDPKIDPVVTIQNTCIWNYGETVSSSEPFWPGYVFQDTVVADPQYADADNADFTLPEGSRLLTAGKDGGAIGDPRWATNAASVKRQESLPINFSLRQNYPNPFNPLTTIEFSIVKKATVRLNIYDISGSIVTTLINRELNAGVYSVDWNASNFASGIYFFQIDADGMKDIKRMTLLK